MRQSSSSLVVGRSVLPIWADLGGPSHAGRGGGACARGLPGVGGGGGGAASGKCEHKIRQMKTNCAAASFVRSRSFGPLRERERDNFITLP